MARKLRIQFPGAIYHVINRGNYRRDLFISPGEAKAFLATVKETKERMGWRVHAYALMRNHYHLAIETPEPNLVQGMHWLQTTWSSRFNRFRSESGHLFQGRYRALLIENGAVLGKVVDYIHLNPVRAKIVPPEQVKAYRWSSLGEIVRGEGWIDDAGWRAGGRFGGEPEARKAYETYLAEVGLDEARWEELGLMGLSKSWAIGTSGWRRTIAKEHAQLALNPGLEREEVREMRELTWEQAVADGLRAAHRTEEQLNTRPMSQPWKLELADHVQRKAGASVAWLAARLKLGRADSLRSQLSRFRRVNLQQNSAFSE
jgi:REP element-mobilizing transposase RayT